MNNRLFLIDGHALVFKMYYALLRRPMVNSKGVDTSILYGFTKYLFELIEKEHPTHLAVSFDPPGGTFRNVMYPAYKANRDATPQLVIDALQPLTDICRALDIPVLMMPGFEADDVIGSMAKREGREGCDVYMVTPDKDYGQLIAEHIFQIKPGKGGGENELFDSAAVCAKYGIQRPGQVIDMLAICGDTADNVPGVKGVGEVGASKLIGRYGSLEGIYEHLDELSEKQRRMFLDAQDHIGLSKQLVTIKTDIEIATTLEEMELSGHYGPEAVEIFKLYEFSSLLRYLGDVKMPVEEKKTSEVFEVEEITPAELYRTAVEEGCCSLVIDGNRAYAAVSGRRAAKGNADGFAALMADDTIAKYGYEMKAQLKEHEIKGKLKDIALMDYLINPEKSHRLDHLARTELGVELEEVEAQPENVGLTLFDDVPEEDEGAPDRLREAAVIRELGPRVEEKMDGNGLTSLYDEMEEPLIRVLSGMEKEGVTVNLESLREFAEGLRREVDARQRTIREMAGEPELNVLSPKQIGSVLFEKLKLDPKAKPGKGGGYSTDEETLLALADRHPIVNEILEFRAAKKLLSTYIEPFPEYISPVSGKVHTTFNQALTATGRLSSSKPNLQNIPIRTERGKEIRKAFVPSHPDGVIMSADYSQIELRIMAHLCRDSHMLEAFNAGTDVHKATAAKIFGVPVSEVTDAQRRIAKTANFGIMYGISSFGLSQRLGCSRSEAKKIIDDYFAGFPSIREFIDRTVEAAGKNGYVETLFGRRRYLPDISARNATVRALAERNAVNAPIQGTSADIIKLAMIAVDRRIREEGLKSRMVLQIHDELLFDAVAEETDRLRDIVVHEMENVIELSIPLTVECNYGENWLEAH